MVLDGVTYASEEDFIEKFKSAGYTLLYGSKPDGPVAVTPVTDGVYKMDEHFQYILMIPKDKFDSVNI